LRYKHVFDLRGKKPGGRDYFWHLPGIPSAKQVNQEGISIGEMNAFLLKKVDELTLHMIELNKENKELRTLINQIAKDKPKNQ
jgi:hypothetical protein